MLRQVTATPAVALVAPRDALSRHACRCRVVASVRCGDGGCRGVAVRRHSRAVSARRCDVPAQHVLQAVHQLQRVRPERVCAAGTICIVSRHAKLPCRVVVCCCPMVAHESVCGFVMRTCRITPTRPLSCQRRIPRAAVVRATAETAPQCGDSARTQRHWRVSVQGRLSVG